MLLLGRRRADGNYTGKDGLYTNGQGVTRFSPLYDWPHEYILAYIHYHQLALPPIYQWQDGFVRGTHPWPARTGTASEEQGWLAAGIVAGAFAAAPVSAQQPIKIGFGMAPKVAETMADLLTEGQDRVPQGFRPEALLGS